MLSKVTSAALIGMECVSVTVEVDYSHSGMPYTEMVGLPGAAVKESRERVGRAIKNSGYNVVPGKLVINLAPADIKKEGPMYDLPIAIGQLAAAGHITDSYQNFFFLGELSLDGGLRPVNGVLPICAQMHRAGFTAAVVPAANAAEASFVEGLDVFAFSELTALVDFLNGTTDVKPVPPANWRAQDEGGVAVDFASIRGQSAAKRAAEIAAAGGHNLLLVGPPGSGKTMLAKAAAGILPDMTFDEAMMTTEVYSVAGKLSSDGFITKRPFRSPHHSTSSVALTGGGSKAKPGEISLAHNGVLFLDELTEFRKDVLESLRQPLEDGVITVARAENRAEYPAAFMLIASMNPCPCGHFGSVTHKCSCTPQQIQKYIGKISGPFLDRIDLHVEMNAISYDEFSAPEAAETSADVRTRVNEARARQLQRFYGQGVRCNAQMDAKLRERYCPLGKSASDILAAASQSYGFSARSLTRLIKVARTIADLADCADIMPQHIAEAIQYRIIDRKYWGYRYDS